MSKFAGLRGPWGGALAVMGIAVVAGIVAIVTGVFTPAPEESPEPVMPEAAVKAALPPNSEDTPGAKVAVEPAATPTPDPDTVQQGEADTPPVTAPTFDLVRVEPDGSTTIAGRANPGATVAIEMEGQEVGRVTTSGDGSFVKFLDIEPSANPRLVRLRVMLADGEHVYSSDNALIAPMVVAQVAPEPETPAPVVGDRPEPSEYMAEKPAVVTAAADPEPGEPAAGDSGDAVPATEVEPAPVEVASVDPAPAQPAKDPAEDVATKPEPVTTDAGQTAPVISAQEPEPNPEPEPIEAAGVAPKAEPEPTVTDAATPTAMADKAPDPDPEPRPSGAPEAAKAPAVIIASSEGVKVVQPPSPAPEVMSAVALDTISYSDAGDVQLAGRGQGQGFVRVYVDNRPITTSRIEADGNWRSGLPDVDTGIYTLRVDELSPEGEVVSRVETPFKREAQKVVAEAGQVKAITVQPGNTLWAIAQDSYGAGNLYVRLFEANKDRIRNPDLIYPGQVFDIPRD